MTGVTFNLFFYKNFIQLKVKILQNICFVFETWSRHENRLSIVRPRFFTLALYGIVRPSTSSTANKAGSQPISLHIIMACVFALLRLMPLSLKFIKILCFKWSQKLFLQKSLVYFFLKSTQIINA
jgi:hypothetical protein